MAASADKYEVDHAEKNLVKSSEKGHRLVHQVSQDEREMELQANSHLIFHLFDTDGSGFIEKAEMQQALLLLGMPAEDADVDVFISEVDQNQDGLIQPAEFQDFYMSKMRGQKTL
jgi:Ca2+-binding EF-hand superfamily protein